MWKNKLGALPRWKVLSASGLALFGAIYRIIGAVSNIEYVLTHLKKWGQLATTAVLHFGDLFILSGLLWLGYLLFRPEKNGHKADATENPLRLEFKASNWEITIEDMGNQTPSALNLGGLQQTKRKTYWIDVYNSSTTNNIHDVSVAIVKLDKLKPTGQVDSLGFKGTNFPPIGLNSAIGKQLWLICHPTGGNELM